MRSLFFLSRYPLLCQTLLSLTPGLQRLSTCTNATHLVPVYSGKTSWPGSLLRINVKEHMWTLVSPGLFVLTWTNSEFHRYTCILVISRSRLWCLDSIYCIFEDGSEHGPLLISNICIHHPFLRQPLFHNVAVGYQTPDCYNHQYHPIHLGWRVWRLKRPSACSNNELI